MREILEYLSRLGFASVCLALMWINGFREALVFVPLAAWLLIFAFSPVFHKVQEFKQVERIQAKPLDSKKPVMKPVDKWGNVSVWP